jgi:hypothetical protein
MERPQRPRSNRQGSRAQRFRFFGCPLPRTTGADSRNSTPCHMIEAKSSSLMARALVSERSSWTCWRYTQWRIPRLLSVETTAAGNSPCTVCKSSAPALTPVPSPYTFLWRNRLAPVVRGLRHASVFQAELLCFVPCHEKNAIRVCVITLSARLEQRENTADGLFQQPARSTRSIVKMSQPARLSLPLHPRHSR